MATIGYVTRNDDGSYKGELLTLSLSIPLTLVPIEKTKKDAPSWRIMSGRAEVGAAWLNENAETGKTHISLTIDAPELPRKLNANLGPAPAQDDEDVFAIIWNRPKN